MSLANKVGASDVVARLSDDLKDDSELYRRMVLEAVQASSRGSRRGEGGMLRRMLILLLILPPPLAEGAVEPRRGGH